jgi:hypothetical protein
MCEALGSMFQTLQKKKGKGKPKIPPNWQIYAALLGK